MVSTKLSNLNPLDVVKRKVRTFTGDIIDSVEKIDFQRYLENSCQKFYNARPIMKSKRVLVQLGTSTYNVDSLTQTLFPSNVAPKLYFLGLVYSNYMLQGEELLSGGANISPFNVWFYQNLMGFAGMAGIGATGSGSPYTNQALAPLVQDPLAYNLYATQKDRILGDETFEFDPINNSIKITAPAEGSCTLIACYGYNGTPGDSVDTPLVGVGYNYLELIAKLVAEEIFCDLLMSRGLMKLAEQDFEFNVELMQSRYDKLNMENSADLGAITVPYCLMA